MISQKKTPLVYVYAWEKHSDFNHELLQVIELATDTWSQQNRLQFHSIPDKSYLKFNKAVTKKNIQFFKIISFCWDCFGMLHMGLTEISINERGFLKNIYDTV